MSDELKVYNATPIFYNYKVGKVDGKTTIETYLTKSNGEVIGVYIDLDLQQTLALIANLQKAMML
jgi:hypothetical protein